MTTVRIICGPARSGLTTYALGRYADTVRRSGFDSAVLLLPSAAQTATVRECLVRDCGFKGLLDAKIFTFPELAQSVLDTNDAAVTAISPTAQRVLVRHIIRRFAQAGQLQYLNEVRNLDGFIEALLQFFGDLKRAAVEPQVFCQALQAAGLGDEPRSRELRGLYCAYQEALISRRLFDEEGKFWWARRVLRDGHRKPIAEADTLLVDGFADFTSTQIEMLAALAEGMTRCEITLPHDPERPELFALVEDTIGRLQAAFPDAAVEPLQTHSPPPSGVAALHHLAENLFCDEPSPVSAGDAVRIMVAAGPRAEVQQLAREVKRLCVEEQVPPEDIAVVWRRLDDVAPLIESAFSEYGLPCSIQAGARPTASNAVRTALALLDLQLNNFPRADVVAFLTSGYTHFAPSTAQDFRAEELDLFSREARVVGGTDGWRDALAGYVNRLRNLIAHPRPEYDEDEERISPEQAGEILPRIQLAQNLLTDFFWVFDQLPPHAPLGEHVRAYRRALNAFGIPQALAEPDCPEATARDVAAMEALLHALEELEQADQTFGAGEAVDIASFATELRLALTHLPGERRGSSPGRVTVLEAHDVRQLVFPYVFVCGLNEGRFPVPRRRGVFYGDEDIARLQQHAIGLRTSALRQREEMLLFYSAVTRWTNRLYLSYSEADASGRETICSHYLEELQSCFEDLPTTGPSRHPALVPRPSQAWSGGELLTGTMVALWVGAEDPSAAWSSYNVLAADHREPLRSALAAAFVESERSSPTPPGIYDGVLQSPAIQKDLAERLGTQHVFSPSQLGEYGICPFRFFAHRVLRLQELEEPTETIEAAQRGTLGHRIARLVFEAIHQEWPTEPLSNDHLPRALELAQKQVTKCFQTPGPGVNRQLWQIERQLWMEIVEALLRHEVERLRDAPGWVPTHFEAAYGGKSKVSDFVIGTGEEVVRIAGRIDRIDRLFTGGRPASPEQYAVFDYKTGSVPKNSLQQIATGLDFQLPMYAEAAKLVLNEPNAVCATWGYYKLRRPIKIKGEPKKDRTVAEYVQEAEQHALRHVRQMRKGNFVDNPPGDCKYCTYRRICRYQRWRMELKVPGDTSV